MTIPSVTRTTRARVAPFTAERLKADYGFCNLLTPPNYNPKTAKGRKRGYHTSIQHFAPSRQSGRNMCGKHASPECIRLCLNLAGRGGMLSGAPGRLTADRVQDGMSNEIQDARVARSNMFFDKGKNYRDLLVHECETAERRAIANGFHCSIRPNGTSDLPWERIAMNDGRTIFEHFPNVTFYDYTKDPSRAVLHALGKLGPANYHLTFSRSELNEKDCLRILALGGNVAVVFSTKGGRNKEALPATWHGYTVIDGDDDDLRFLDPKGVVVGLRAKGPAIGDTSGFVVIPSEENA